MGKAAEKLINDYLKRGRCRVFGANDELVGVYVLLATRPDTVELVNVAAVREHVQGGGIGKTLIMHALKTARRVFKKPQRMSWMSTSRRYAERYGDTCEYLCRSGHEAEDLVQTTLLKAMPMFRSERVHPNLSALLRRIAQNTWIDEVRSRAKYKFCDPDVLANLSAVEPVDFTDDLCKVTA